MFDWFNVQCSMLKIINFDKWNTFSSLDNWHYFLNWNISIDCHFNDWLNNRTVTTIPFHCPKIGILKSYISHWTRWWKTGQFKNHNVSRIIPTLYNKSSKRINLMSIGSIIEKENKKGEAYPNLKWQMIA